MLTFEKNTDIQSSLLFSDLKKSVQKLNNSDLATKSDLSAQNNIYNVMITFASQLKNDNESIKQSIKAEFSKSPSEQRVSTMVSRMGRDISLMSNELTKHFTLGSESENNLKSIILKHIEDSFFDLQKNIVDDFTLNIKQSDKLDISAVLNFIENYDIKDQKTVMKIAQSCVEKNYKAASENFHLFKIKNLKFRFEMAKQIAQQNAWVISLYIKNFEITNSEARLAICELSALKDGVRTAMSFENYEIDEEVSRFNIAKLCAQQNVRGAAANIKNFHLNHQPYLIDIAMRCARIDGGATAIHIPKFGISDQNALIEIAKLCVLKSEFEMTNVIRNFGLNIQPFSQNYYFLIHNNKKICSEELFVILKKWIFASFPDTQFLNLCNTIEEVKNQQIRFEKFILLSKFLFLMDFCLSKENIQWIDQQHLLPGVLNFSRPDLRLPIFKMIIVYLGKSDFPQLAKKLTGSKIERDWMIIARLLLSALCTDGMDLKIAQKLIAKTSSRTDSIFYKGINHKIYIELLMKLKAFSPIDIIVKGQLIEKIVDDINSDLKISLASPGAIQIKTSRKVKQGKRIEKVAVSPERIESALFNNMQTLLSMISIGKVDLLKNSDYTLKENLECFLQKELALAKIDNFSEKYLKIFGSCREPYALTTYIGKIFSTKDTAALKCLGNYISSVLIGNFENERNNLQQNLHLRTIDDAYPGLLKKWQTPLASMKLGGSNLIKPDRKTDPSANELMVIDSSDPIDLLLCGTEISNSCQSVASNPNHNKGLLAYLMDGKIRLIAIKDIHNRTLFRCILRILWDGEKPVLHCECVYPQNGTTPKEYENALFEMASRKASQTGLEIIFYAKPDQPSSKKLFAMGNNIPWEYCDSAHGVKAWGKYEF